MAHDPSQTRTEQPTQRKLERSREKGQVAYSADLTGGIVLLLVSQLLALLGSDLWNQVKRETAGLLFAAGDLRELDADGMAALWQWSWGLASTCLPVAAVAFVVSLLLGGLPGGFRFAAKSLEVDFSKLDVVQGFSRLISRRSLFRGLMAILKLVAVSVILYLVLAPGASRIGWTIASPLDQTADLALSIVIAMLPGVSGGLTAIGILDFAFQKWKHIEDLKMSRQELRDEQKEDDGDPHVRARIRRLRREMAQRSLPRDIATATLVVTNPTHYAMALRYRDGEMNAPVVVAKGRDHLAQKIIRLADLHRVPRVERKPLAQALYANVPVGAEIPLELYHAVAEVLAYVHELNRNARRAA